MSACVCPSSSLPGWTLQQVDLSSLSREIWDSFEWTGAALWGCVLPKHTSEADLQARGASVLMQPVGVPFLAIRARKLLFSE